MTMIFNRPLPEIAEALRRREVSAVELTEETIRRHEATESSLAAYKHWDPKGALDAARRADARLRTESEPAAFCGIPVSVKDLYGVEGLPTFAGTARRLPRAWETDAWLIRRLRSQGAVFTGKTHTVELAYGAVGVNPHWDTPWNPWDAEVARIPGGSSCGAGVSLWTGSALLALGSDTGGSIRIPASMTGTVGHRTTPGRWPVEGVVPLSPTLDTVGALARSVQDSAFFFGALDPVWGDPQAFSCEIAGREAAGISVGIPRCRIWSDCQPDIAERLHATLGELGSSGWARTESDGHLLDTAQALYLTGGITAAECLAFLRRDLPEWLEILHPSVGQRLEGAPSLDSFEYREALIERDRLVARAGTLFDRVDVLALPTAILTPPPLSEICELDRYVEVNLAALAPTSPASLLGLCAITLPVGLDETGMPVGLQLVAPAHRDEKLLAVALAAERVLGTAPERLGTPPACRPGPVPVGGLPPPLG